MTASAHRSDGVPELRAGDRLTRPEFHRRYEAMSEVKKAELVEGVVYMPSPVSLRRHGRPHGLLVWWLGHYGMRTPGVQIGDNASVFLDQDNELQPDALLRILPRCGGQSRDAGDYVAAAPELVAEVTATSASYDLHDKLHAYRRNGVREYLVWRVDDAAIDWFALCDGLYAPLRPDGEGTVRSEVFPGLWLATRALLEGDQPAVLAVLEAGCATPGHASLAERLRRAL
jgi:Uma2 family endonuclease